MTEPFDRHDLPALAELNGRWEDHWLGGVENHAGEFAEQFAHVPDDQAAVVRVDGVVVGGAWWWSNAGSLIVDPARSDGDAIRAALLDWCATSGAAQLEVLATDEALRAALTERDWRHDHSAFELLRPTDPGWQLDTPSWPDGLDIVALGEVALPDLHALIYRDARWADVPGHAERPLAEWRSLFVDPAPAELQVLAVRDGRLVGAALNRIFGDGTGWVGQLATARSARGLGLGRALLLEALTRLRAAGATSLGLGVQAVNAHALRLYESVGLRVVREWQTWQPA